MITNTAMHYISNKKLQSFVTVRIIFVLIFTRQLISQFHQLSRSSRLFFESDMTVVKVLGYSANAAKNIMF